jgi:hypothetical protein
MAIARVHGYFALTPPGPKVLGNSLSLNGNGGLFDPTMAGLIDQANGTWEMWFKTTTVPFTAITAASAVPGNQGWTWAWTTATNILMEDQGGNGSQNYTTPPVNDGAWHHFVVTIHSGTGTKQYLDGVLVGTGVTLNVIWAVGSQSGHPGVWFGQQQARAHGNLNGGIAEVAGYSAAELSATRVAAHFNAATTPAAYQAAVLADSPSRFWPCTDALGSTSAADVSGNNEAASLGSGAAFVAGWIR